MALFAKRGGAADAAKEIGAQLSEAIREVGVRAAPKAPFDALCRQKAATMRRAEEREVRGGGWQRSTICRAGPFFGPTETAEPRDAAHGKVEREMQLTATLPGVQPGYTRGGQGGAPTQRSSRECSLRPDPTH